MRRLAFQLAERLGMTVAELGRRMSYEEFAEWGAWLRIHLDDSWYQNAMVRLTLLRCNGDKTTQLKDLLPERFKGPENLRSKILAFVATFNAAAAERIKRNGGIEDERCRP